MAKQSQKRTEKPFQRRPASLPDAFNVFAHARRFMDAEERLRGKGAASRELNDFIESALPSNVLSAFACELFLKTLLILEGKVPADSHTLSSLHKKLDNRTKDRLELLWKISVAHSCGHLDFIERKMGVRLPRDLRGSLKECGDAFKVIRYHYEAPNKSRYYLTDFPRILYGHILERKPEWDPDQIAAKALASVVRANRPK